MKETTFDEQSSLKIYSLGIVIKAEDPVTKEIQVSPIESMNLQQPGVISQNKIEFRGSHPDDKGISVTGNVKAENYVKAKWICIGSSNRVTAPDVYPNETVLLFRYSNNDVYYWTSIFHEPELRKKEAVTFGVSNLSVTKGWTGNTPMAYTKETGYWLDIDAIKKMVSFTTPDNDGEFAKYTFEIDAAKSTLNINDNKGNFIAIDSKKGIVVTSDMKVVVRGKAQVDVESSTLINLTAPRVVVTGNLVVKGKITCNELDVNQNLQVNAGLNVSFITTNSLGKPWTGKKNMSGLLNSNASTSSATTTTSTTTATTSSGASGSPSADTAVTTNNGYTQVDYMTAGTLNSNNSSTSTLGISTSGGVTTYTGNSYINANGDQIHELSGTIIRSGSDLRRELEDLKGTISQVIYDSRLLYLTTPTNPDGTAATTATVSNAVVDVAASLAASAAAELTKQNSAYQSFLQAQQVIINANPDSQAAKDAISNPPSINPSQNADFVAFYTSGGATAAAAVPVAAAPTIGEGSPLFNAIRNLNT